MTIVKPTLHALAQSGAGSSTANTAVDLEGALVICAISGTVSDYNIETRPTAGSFISANGRTPRGGEEVLDALSAGGIFVLTPAGTDDADQDEIRITIITGTGVVTCVVIDGADLTDWLPNVTEARRRG